MQRTLKSATYFTGVGLHGGHAVRMVVHPASAETGIWFKRTDINGPQDNMIPARWDHVEQSQLCTLLINDAGVSVSTVEHLMAALYGCGIHNAIVELDGPEVPILDGSSIEFVKSFLNTGLVDQATPVRAIKVLKSVSVTQGDVTASLAPSPVLEMDFAIEFSEAAIGAQQKTVTMANGAFVHTLCDSRTFCKNSDVQAMRAMGLVRGGTMDNAIVFDGDKVLSPSGLRHSDEPVRHKLLDAVGDLALAGAPLFAKYSGHKAGHAVTNKLLRALFADTSNYQMIECTPEQSQLLPGSGVLRSDVPELA